MVTARDPVGGVQAEVWASTAEACRHLSATEWQQATDCPGWSVQDQLSHVVGIERTLLGEPGPEPVAEWPPHVHNEFGAAVEASVAVRRAHTGPEVLGEFAEVTGRRLAALEAMDPDQFAVITPGP